MNRGVLIAAVAVLLITGGILFVYFSIPKIGYINSSRVFNEFGLKKDLEKDLKKLESSRQSVLDSMQLELNLKFDDVNGKKNYSQKEVDDYKRLQQQYYLKEKRFNEDYEAMADQYTQQVWKQLNQFIQEYGAQRGYDYIFGTKGEGEIMYAKDSDDLTEAVIQYANSKYEGDIK